MNHQKLIESFDIDDILSERRLNHLISIMHVHDFEEHNYVEHLEHHCYLMMMMMMNDNDDDDDAIRLTSNCCF